MADRVQIVVSQVFGVDAERLKDDDSPDTIEGWDSKGHLNLVTAIEAEFDVSLTATQAEEMLSVGLVRMLLKELGVDVGA